MSDDIIISKAGWKVKDWALSAGLSINYVHELISSGKLRSVKIGGARRIIISPHQFYQKLELKQKAIDIDI